MKLSTVFAACLIFARRTNAPPVVYHVDIMILDLHLQSIASDLEEYLNEAASENSSPGIARDVWPEFIYNVKQGNPKLATDITEAMAFSNSSEIPHTIVTERLSRHFQRSGSASYTVFLMNLSIPDVMASRNVRFSYSRHTYVASHVVNSLDLCRVAGWWGKEEPFFWIDLAAGPFFPPQLSDNVPPQRLTKPNSTEFRSFSPTFRSGTDLLSIATYIHQNIAHAERFPTKSRFFSDDVGRSFQLLVAFQSICDRSLCNETFHADSWKGVFEELGNVSLPDQENVFQVKSGGFCDVAKEPSLMAALASSKQSRKRNHLLLNSRKLGKLLRDINGRNKSCFFKFNNSLNILPVYVLDFKTRYPLLFDNGHQVVTLSDMVLAIQTRAFVQPSAMSGDNAIAANCHVESRFDCPVERLSAASAARSTMYSILDMTFGTFPLTMASLKTTVGVNGDQNCDGVRSCNDFEGHNILFKCILCWNPILKFVLPSDDLVRTHESSASYLSFFQQDFSLRSYVKYHIARVLKSHREVTSRIEGGGIDLSESRSTEYGQTFSVMLKSMLYQSERVV